MEEVVFESEVDYIGQHKTQSGLNAGRSIPLTDEFILPTSAFPILQITITFRA